MDRHQVTLLQFTGTCKNKHHFKLYGLSDFSYGQKLGRTPNPDNFTVLDCLGDPVCDEVVSLLSAVLGHPLDDDRRKWNCFEASLGVACDPASSGHTYDFTGRVWCPICGTTDARYAPVIPDIVEVVDIPRITHTQWNALSIEEKLARLRIALQVAGCLPDATTS